MNRNCVNTIKASNRILTRKSTCINAQRSVQIKEIWVPLCGPQHPSFMLFHGDFSHKNEFELKRTDGGTTDVCTCNVTFYFKIIPAIKTNENLGGYRIFYLL